MPVDPFKLMYYGAINIFKGLNIMYISAKNISRAQSLDLRDGVHAMNVDPMLNALMGVINVLRKFKGGSA